MAFVKTDCDTDGDSRKRYFENGRRAIARSILFPSFVKRNRGERRVTSRTKLIVAYLFANEFAL